MLWDKGMLFCLWFAVMPMGTPLFAVPWFLLLFFADRQLNI